LISYSINIGASNRGILKINHCEQSPDYHQKKNYKY